MPTAEEKLRELRQDYEERKAPPELKERLAAMMAEALAGESVAGGQALDAAPTPEERAGRASRLARAGRADGSPTPDGAASSPGALPDRPALSALPRQSRRSWLARFGQGLVAAALLLILSVNASPAMAAYLSEVPLLGSFARLVTFRDYQNDQGNTAANIQTPHLIGMEDQTLQEALNAEFDRYADQLIAQYQEDVKLLAGEGHSSVECSYSVVTDNERLLCLNINTLLIEASGQQLNTYYVIDKERGRLLTLSDLFQEGADYVSPLSKEIIRQMEERMAGDENISFFIAAEDPEPFTAIRPDQQFFIDGEGYLNISFDEYEVAPGAMGALSFRIPSQVLAEILADGAPLTGE